MSKLDIIYRKSFLSLFFGKGWGNFDLLQRMIENHKYVSKRETCIDLIKSFNIITKKEDENSKTITIEGSFQSPFHQLLPNVMDEKNQIAKFQLLIPKTWRNKYKPLCIHFSGTGDHHFYRRKLFLANRLLEDGIASLIHINPFYGYRKPKDQKGSSLNYLTDLFVMGGALILETQVLLQWARKEGFDPLAVHGISMGGHMACLGVSVHPEPVCLIPCLSWTTASHVFTQGAMSSSVSWEVLSDQYKNNEGFRKKIRAAIQSSNFKINDQCQKEGQTQIVIPHKQNLNCYSCESSLIGKFTGTQRKFWFIRGLEYGPFSNLINKKVVYNDTPETHLNSKLFFDTIFSKSQAVDQEIVEFLRDMLDFFTHLGNYSVPFDTRLVTVVVAGDDAYIPMHGVSHFHDVWDTRCDIRIREGIGHIEAYLRSSLWTEDRFREGIVDTMNRYVELYKNEVGPFGKIKT